MNGHDGGQLVIKNALRTAESLKKCSTNAKLIQSRTLVGLNSNNFQQLNADDWLSVLEVYPEPAHEVDARKPAGRFILSFSAIRRHWNHPTDQNTFC